MMTMPNDRKSPRFRQGEKSFTLLETVIALGLMVTIILEVSSVQGGAINFGRFARKVTQATWLAKAVMSEVEYRSKFYPLKELKSDATMKNREISESLCPKDPIYDCDFTYTVTIDDFKLPIIDILLGDKSDDSKEDSSGKADDPMASLIRDKVKEILGDDILKLAKVEVFWPEGATRDSVTLTYLLANQNGLDEYIEQLPPLKNGNRAPCPENHVLRDGKCVKNTTTPNTGEGGAQPNAGGGSGDGSGGTSEGASQGGNQGASDGQGGESAKG